MKTRIKFLITLFLLNFYLTVSGQQKQAITANGNERCTVATICTNPCCGGDYLAYDLSCKSYFQVENGQATRVTNLRDVRLRYNREFKFKILNVNRYLYNIDLAADNVHFGNQPPLLFRQLFLGESADSLIGTLTGNTKKSVLTSIPRVKLFLAAYATFKKSYDSLRNNQLKAFSTCPQDLPCNCGQLSFSELSNQLTALKDAYVAAQAALSDVKTKKEQELETCTENEKNNDARAVIESKLKELRKAKNPDQKKIKELQDQLEDLPGCDKETKKVYENERDEAVSTSKTLEEIFKVITSLSEGELFRLILFNNNLKADDFVYSAPPIFPQGNRLELALKIAPNDTAKKLMITPLHNDSLFLDLPVLYKPYISFSSGLFYAGGRKLESDQYAFRAVAEDGVTGYTDTAQYTLVNTGSSRTSLGFAALANMGMRLGYSWGAGVSAGVGLTIEENPRPAYLVGLSAYWGDRSQFNLTFGCAMLRVNRLKKDLYPNEAVYSPKPDIQYQKPLRAGFFVSLSYAVFELEKKRAVRSGK